MLNSTTTASRESGKGLTTGSSTTPPSSAISTHSLIKGTPKHIREWLISLPQAPLASPSPSQEKDWVNSTLVTKYPPLCELSKLSDLCGYYWKTVQGCLPGMESTSAKYFTNWPTSGMTRNGRCYPQNLSAPLICEKDSGLWPTPRTRGLLGGSGSRRMVERKVAAGQITNEEARQMLGVKMLPTPRSAMTGAVTPNRARDKFRNLESVIAKEMFPTPTASDCKKGPRRKKDRRSYYELANFVQMFPTPTCQDAKQSASASCFKRKTIPLNAFVHQFPTPTSSMATGADFVQAKFHSSKRPSYKKSETISQAGEKGAKKKLLNPEFIEWMMGWIIGWSSIKPLSGKNIQDWRERTGAGVWWLEETVSRLADSDKEIRKRQKAIGNGQVPGCVVAAWELLS